MLHAVPDTHDGPVDRVPPSNLDAEQSVLGGMLLSRAAIADVADVLDPADFYRPAHETIYRAILAMHADGEPADPITVAARLRKDGDLERVGGPSYLHACVSTVPAAASTEYYADIVRNLAMLRRIVETGTHLAQMGYAARHDPEQAAEVLDAAAAHLQALTAATAGRTESREWLLDKVIDDVLTDYDRPAGDNLPLPWRDMTEKAPMEPGDFVVVAARPAMGKTLVLLEIARHAAIRHGRGALIASMEMSHRQMGQRILVAEAGVSLARFRARELDPNEREAVDEAAGRILTAPLRIDDTPAVPISKWRARLRQLQAEGQLPAVLIVDYLQIAKAETASGTNRTGEVDSLAAGMKALAQEFGIVVIAAAQLNRQVELRQDKTPTLADLRESGAIEANANIVIMLHRPDYYEPESPRAGEIDLIIGKNRMGTTGIVTCAFQGRRARVVDMGR
jgi:replicative DNA helicase